MVAPMSIAGVPIGQANSPFVIAEMSGNHNGRLDRALAIVDAVAKSGAHSLKLQTYRADTITIDVSGPPFQIEADHDLWGGRNLYSLYEEAHTPWEWHEPLFQRARSRGLIAFSSPFDPTAVAFLEDLACPAYKVASAELVDLPLIATMAGTGKPLIMSTGMATLAEIDAAVTTARKAGATEVALLACTAAYPADPADANLSSMAVLRDAFDVPVGLSDHTEGVAVAVAASALGAALIEKHVTVDREEGGVDAAFSLDPEELRRLVHETRMAHAAVGTPRFGPRESEQQMLSLRRSLYVVEDVEAGEAVTVNNVRSIRPAGGLAAAMLEQLLGRTFTSAARRGTPLSFDLL